MNTTNGYLKKVTRVCLALALVPAWMACNKSSTSEYGENPQQPPTESDSARKDAMTPSEAEKQMPPSEAAPAQLGTASDAEKEDAAITAEIKEKFINDSQLKMFDLKVETKACVVTLKGTVDKQEQSARAEQLARETPKVKDVNNELTVRPIASE